MTQYLVTQKPRAKYRAGLVVVAMIVESPTAMAAIRQAIEAGRIGAERWFDPSPEYCQPYAEPVVPNKVLSF